MSELNESIIINDSYIKSSTNTIKGYTTDRSQKQKAVAFYVDMEKAVKRWQPNNEIFEKKDYSVQVPMNMDLQVK